MCAIWSLYVCLYDTHHTITLHAHTHARTHTHTHTHAHTHTHTHTHTHSPTPLSVFQATMSPSNQELASPLWWTQTTLSPTSSHSPMAQKCGKDCQEAIDLHLSGYLIADTYIRPCYCSYLFIKWRGLYTHLLQDTHN